MRLLVFWLIKFAMCTMMPRTEALPGIADTDLDAWLARLHVEPERFVATMAKAKRKTQKAAEPITEDEADRIRADVKERVELAQANPSFWQDYKFTNPETKKIEPKTMYCERLEQTVVCGGIYK